MRGEGRECVRGERKWRAPFQQRKCVLTENEETSLI